MERVPKLESLQEIIEEMREAAVTSETTGPDGPITTANGDG